MPVVVSAPVSTEPWIARSIERGARLAVDDINERGGVTRRRPDRPLELVVLDHAGSPANALAHARQAVRDKAAVLLTDGTGVTSVAAVTDPAKLPVFIVFEGGQDLIEPAAHGRRCSGWRRRTPCWRGGSPTTSPTCSRRWR